MKQNYTSTKKISSSKSFIFSLFIFVYMFSFGVIKTWAADPLTSKFDKTKDILIAQFDNKPDGDDIHSQAALASLLAHADFVGVNYFAVAGAYGKQTGSYINSNTLFSMAFGTKNVKWTDAKAERANSIIRIRDKAKPILTAGGRVWVQEAGQSDITADWIAALITAGVPAAKIKTNVIIVQHSKWNEDNTTLVDLNYVKKMALYVAIDDGNNNFGVYSLSRPKRLVQTPSYESSTQTYMTEALATNNPNQKVRSFWVEAKRIIDLSGFNASYSVIPKGGVDFSDCVENWYIFNLNGKADGVRQFWDRYVLNSVALNSASFAPKNKQISTDAESGIRIYPNPASSMLNIVFGDSETSKQVKIFNTVGQLIYTSQTDNSSAQIDVQSLKFKGIIMVQVTIGTQISNHKVLIN